MKTPQEALAYARQVWSSDVRTYHEKCLGFVGDCWDEHYYGRAIWAWEGATDKHLWVPGESHLDDIPLGSPFWSTRPGDPYGHVFIVGRYSASGARVCWSTDVKSSEPGAVNPVPLAFFHDVWGHELLGWSPNFNKAVLPLGPGLKRPLPPGQPRLVSLRAITRAASTDPFQGQGHVTAGSADDVRIVEQALESLGWLPASLAADGSFGTSTVAAYVRWQRRLGYTGAAADGVPGRASLEALGQRFGFQVAA